MSQVRRFSAREVQKRLLSLEGNMDSNVAKLLINKAEASQSVGHAILLLHAHGEAVGY